MAEHRAQRPADPASPPEWGGTIRNGSDLPVYQVAIEFEPIGGGGLVSHMSGARASGLLVL